MSLEAVDTRLEQAARTLGANPWRVVFHHHLTRFRCPVVIVGVVLAFARSLGEFGAHHHPLFPNIPGETRTIPLAMYTLIETPGAEAAAARLCVIAIVLALAALMVSEWLARWGRKRMGL
ncbi:Molybdenum transport system permease protein modB [Serratia fonticola]|uniref:Molybdenum transport system permease protein modB n=1 Tax=Serratia fonticola TaxID=47917 RepID=A0A4U9VX35_SERFO|nr:Molybdenum transport system permease protein modB [Serratia fonticola]